MDIRQTNCPSRHKGALGVFRGSNIQMSGEALKRFDRLEPNLYMSADSTGNGHSYNSPLNATGGISGGFRGHTFKSGNAAKRVDRLAPSSVHVCGFIWEWT